MREGKPRYASASQKTVSIPWRCIILADNYLVHGRGSTGKGEELVQGKREGTRVVKGVPCVYGGYVRSLHEVTFKRHRVLAVGGSLLISRTGGLITGPRLKARRSAYISSAKQFAKYFPRGPLSGYEKLFLRPPERPAEKEEKYRIK